jgi:hypothetical protein
VGQADICLPEPPPRGTSPVGGPCEKNTDCAGKAGYTFCWEYYFEGETYGYVNGYCIMVDCITNGCPKGSNCLQLNPGESLCMANCSDHWDCRYDEGYDCTIFVDEAYPFAVEKSGICRPGCGGNSTCPNGYTCGSEEEFCIPAD